MVTKLTEPQASSKLRKLVILETHVQQGKSDEIALTLVRRIVDFSGVNSSVSWLADDIPKSYRESDALSEPGVLKLAHVHAKKAVKLLGQNQPLICYIASPLDANTIAAAAGSIVEGGLLLVSISEEAAKTHYFQFLCARLSETYGDRSHDTIYHIRYNDGAFHLRGAETTTEQLTHGLISHLASGLSHASAASEIKALRANDEQADFVAAISKKFIAPENDQKSLATLLQARRGRGKSTALGFLAREWLACHEGNSVLLAAPSRKHAEPVIRLVKGGGQGVYKRFLFLSADDLLLKLGRGEVDITPSTMLIIDEAAVIASSLLKSMATVGSRLVLSTTTEGYEGSGQGFLKRYIEQLKKMFDDFEVFHLENTLRWGSDDRIERFVDDICGLYWSNTSDYHLPLNLVWPKQAFVDNECGELTLLKLDATQLLDNYSLLREIVELLIDAHYRTRPSDLQQLLDGTAPGAGRHLWIARRTGERAADVRYASSEGLTRQIVGVLLCVEEGYPQSPKLASEVALGRRRPKGNLAAQKLASNYCESRWLRTRSLRISRIAVADGFRRSGVASRLIARMEDYCRTESFSYWSSSFGEVPELNAFWNSTGSSKLFKGVKIENSSGTNTCIVAKSLTKKQEQGHQIQISKLIHTAHALFLMDQFSMGGIPDEDAKAPVGINSETAELEYFNFQGIDNGNAGENKQEIEHALHRLDDGRLRRLVDGTLDINSTEPSLRRYLAARAPEELLFAGQEITVAKGLDLMQKNSPDWSNLAKALSFDGKGELVKAFMHYLKRNGVSEEQ